MSAGGSKTTQNSQSESFIDPTQLGFLNKLWGSAASGINPGQQAAGAQAAAAPGAAGSQQGLNFLSGVMRNPNAGQGGVIAGLTQLGNLGAAKAEAAPALTTLRGLMNPQAQIAAQSKSLKTGLGNLFAQEINPAIKGSAIAAGGFGGGRQGVAQGVAAGQLGDTYAENLGNIVSGANAQAMSAAGGYGDLLSGLRSGALTAQGALGDLLSGNRAAGLDAASMIPALGQARQQFGTAGMTQRTAALQALASIFGDPTTLARSRAGGKSKDFKFGWSSS